jgi:NADH dehydrogenase FAD-containing subunit
VRKLKEKNIDVVYGSNVAKIEADGVTLINGTKLSCNVAIWATGAEA